MGEPARDDADVVDLADYLRETLSRMDEVMAQYVADRHEMALRLAAIDTARSKAVLDAAEDFQRRLVEDEPYGDAEDAETLLGEAIRRYALPT